MLCDAVPKEKIHIERSVIARAQPFLHDLQVDQKLRNVCLDSAILATQDSFNLTRRAGAFVTGLQSTQSDSGEGQ